MKPTRPMAPMLKLKSICRSRSGVWAVWLYVTDELRSDPRSSWLLYCCWSCRLCKGPGSVRWRWEEKGGNEERIGSRRYSLVYLISLDGNFHAVWEASDLSKRNLVFATRSISLQQPLHYFFFLWKLIEYSLLKRVHAWKLKMFRN